MLSAEEVNKLFNNSLNHLLQKQYDEAKSGFEEVLRNNPNSAEAHLNIGNVYLFQDQNELAIPHYEQALKVDPTLTKAYTNLGSCYFKKNKLDEAIGYWNIAINLNHNNALLHRNIAVAYENNGNKQKAFKHYEEFLKHNTKNDKTALMIQRKVNESKRVAYHNLNVGITHQKRKKWNDAALAFKKSIEVYPNFSKAHLNLGSIFYRNNMLNEAISSWEATLKLEPDHANTHCNLGVAYDKQQKIDEACYHYKKYLELTHAQVKDADEVKKRIDELMTRLKEKKELVRQHVNLGNELFNKKNFEDAITEYKKYLLLNPSASDVQTIQKQIDEAITRLNPVKKASESALKIADEYYAAALFDKAITAYNRYLSLNPTGSKANEVKKKLDMCHKHISNVVSAMLKSD